MLAQLEHENMIEAIALAGGNTHGAVVRREGGVALIATDGLRTVVEYMGYVDPASPAHAATSSP